jgi:hypothetical protein
MPRGQIEAVIRKLTKLGKLIYINEMCDSDSADESFYLFHHNYVELFNKYGFKVIQKGLLGNKTWFLFSENI